VDADKASSPEQRGEAWWKSAVVYQVYVRSFADSDGDGIGDLPGLLAHVDHLADLGIDVIWLSPVYPSPQKDNGYDISDYYGVEPLFGDLADLDAVIEAAHQRGMRLILDLVVNHTSSAHAWFVESRRARNDPKSDWYFWRDARAGTVPGTPGSEPNNWGSVFSGPAWEWCPERGQYYLHLFDVDQPDLNWENPEVRDAVFTMMNWWLDRGVDGFRMDVINFISKDAALPDGAVTKSGYGDGMPYFSHGPQIHAYLAEMRRRVFEHRPGTYLTVGEMPGVTPQQAQEFTDQASGTLAMVFHFDHMTLDQQEDKWTRRPVVVSDLRSTLNHWQEALAQDGWNSLYWSNHDQPRVVSRYGDDGPYWFESATALATVLHLLRGTPYVYQGEELGMTNVPFERIEDFRDVETLRYYDEQVHRRGADPAAVIEVLRHASRDNARTPMQWTAEPQAGFTTGTPWIPVNPNHVRINAAQQRDDGGSIYRYYRKLIRFRHEEAAVVTGDCKLVDIGSDTTYAFSRSLGSNRLTVLANLSGTTVSVAGMDPGPVVLANRPAHRCDGNSLGPWEARVHRSSTSLKRSLGPTP
jgi:oligo-1,6-glucosidase